MRTQERRHSGRAVLTALAFVLAGHAGAATLQVDQSTGDDADDGLSWSTAKRTVGAAITAATLTPGADTVRVAAAVYGESVVLVTGVTLEGGYPPGGGSRDLRVNPTTLAANVGAVLQIRGVDDVVVDGFTITGGTGGLYSFWVAYVGGGIFISDSNDVVLRNLVVTGNRLYDFCEARWTGSGCTLGFPNEMPLGTGLYAERSSVRFTNVLVADNTLEYPAFEDLQCWGGCTGFIGPSFASALYLEDCTGVVSNVTVAANTCQSGVSSCDAAFGIRNGVMVVTDSVLFANDFDDYRNGNPDASYSNIGRGNLGGTGNISQDPQFAAGPLGNYYLSQVVAGQPTDSPSVDSGGITAAAAGLDRTTTSTAENPDDSVVDMGFHYPRNLALLCDLVAVDRLTPPDLATAYTSSCGRLAPTSLGGRLAVTVPNVVPQTPFDTASPGVGGELTVYQLGCNCAEAIKLTRDVLADRVVLDW